MCCVLADIPPTTMATDIRRDESFRTAIKNQAWNKLHQFFQTIQRSKSHLIMSSFRLWCEFDKCVCSVNILQSGPTQFYSWNWRILVARRFTSIQFDIVNCPFFIEQYSNKTFLNCPYYQLNKLSIEQSVNWPKNIPSYW